MLATTHHSLGGCTIEAPQFPLVNNLGNSMIHTLYRYYKKKRQGNPDLQAKANARTPSCTSLNDAYLLFNSKNLSLNFSFFYY